MMTTVDLDQIYVEICSFVIRWTRMGSRPRRAPRMDGGTSRATSGDGGGAGIEISAWATRAREATNDGGMGTTMMHNCGEGGKGPQRDKARPAGCRDGNETRWQGDLSGREKL